MLLMFQDLLYICKIDLPLQNYCSSLDILFGITYIPPENTRYMSRDCFTDIEQEMLNMLKATLNIRL